MHAFSAVTSAGTTPTYPLKETIDIALKHYLSAEPMAHAGFLHGTESTTSRTSVVASDSGAGLCLQFVIAAPDQFRRAPAGPTGGSTELVGSQARTIGSLEAATTPGLSTGRSPVTTVPSGGPQD